MTKLQRDYEKACKAYIVTFCQKQDMVFDGWVEDIVGGVAYCNDFYFNFQDIVWDVNSNQPKGAILEWYYDNVENSGKSINYYSYTKGLRVSHIK